VAPRRRTHAPSSRLATAALVAGTGIVAAGLAVTLEAGALALTVAAVAAYSLIRRPPILLAVFVFVPFFKEAPGLRALPLDPTIALAGLLIVALFDALVIRPGRLVPRKPPIGFLVPVLIIGLALLMGLLWSAEPNYGREKAFKYLTVTLLAALSPFVFLTTEKALLQFLCTIAAGAVLVAVLTPILPPTVAAGIATEYDTRGRFSFGGQIFPARFLFTGALVLFLLPGLTASRWRWTAPVAALGVTFVGFGFGARGPIGAFVATLVAVVLVLALRSGRHLAVVLAAVAISAAVLPFVTVPPTAGQRIEETARDPLATLRGDTRYVLYDQATSMIASDPVLGAGTGSFAAYTAIVSPPRQTLLYPHNIFLELWAEAGVIPVIAFLGAVVGGVWALLGRLVRTCVPRRRQLLTLVLGLFILNFLATQMSGDINHNRATLVFLGLAWMLGRSGRPEEPSSDNP